MSLLALALSSAAGEGCSSMQGSDPGYGGRHNSYFLAKSGGINLQIYNIVTSKPCDILHSAP